MNPPDTVLVLGARGRFGRAAVAAFAQAGWRVLAQARPGAALDLPEGAQARYAPLDDTATLTHAAAGATVVVHALNPVSYTRRAWAREVPALADAALGIAQRLGATLMVPGNVYNFGRKLPARLTEDTPQPGDTHHGHLRVALEQRLQRAAEGGGPRCVVLRAGDFYGAGQGSWLDQALLKDASRGRLTLPGDLDTPHAWAYLPDLAETFTRVARVREHLGAFATLHVKGHTVTGRDWVNALDPHGTLRVGHLPWPLLRTLALVSPTLAALCEMRYLWQRPHALDNTRLSALIGPEPRTPFEQAARLAAAQLDWQPRTTLQPA